MVAEPFAIHIEDAVLDDLKSRIAATRWPQWPADAANWDDGASIGYLRGLLDYWRDGFDWRAREQALNQLDHRRVVIDGETIHFLHAPARSGHRMPLILLHGWPSSFLQMLPILPLLTDPEAHGAPPGSPGFDVVVPSLPGFGFSGIPARTGVHEERIAELFVRLMTDVLGHERFAARGSDLGAGVVEWMMHRFPEHLLAVHLTGIRPVLGAVPNDLSPAEQQFVGQAHGWMMQEAAYAMLQATKPQTAALGVTDSPAGLAGWIIEKFRSWSDCGGDIESRFSRDELLVNLTIYWATGTIGSSMRLYHEAARHPLPPIRLETPAGFLMAAHDLVHPPREWVERTRNVARWTEAGKGGHFLEWEEPELVAADMRAFFSNY